MTVYTPDATLKTSQASPAKAGGTKRSSTRGSEGAGFRTVLDDQRGPGKNVHSQEKPSSSPERSSPSVQTRAGRSVDTGFAFNPANGNGSTSAGAAATSALLRLNALSPSRAGTALALAAGGLSADRTMAPLARMVALRAATFAPQRGTVSHELGSLSARFESGDAGVDAIGYDRQGGTSYGQYQISSRAGTMSAFLDFLDERAPEWARGLRAAGPANTGGRDGAMPREWKRIAVESPDRFARLQREFIEQSHYLPALEEIRERTGVDLRDQPKALQEALWSTAVQHGASGAARLFSKAIEDGGIPSESSARRVIDDLYAARGEQFGSSSPEVRASVRKRFREEREVALRMLDDHNRPGRTIA